MKKRGKKPVAQMDAVALDDQEFLDGLPADAVMEIVLTRSEEWGVGGYVIVNRTHGRLDYFGKLELMKHLAELFRVPSVSLDVLVLDPAPKARRGSGGLH